MDCLPINKYIKYILDVIEKQCFKKILFNGFPQIL